MLVVGRNGWLLAKLPIAATSDNYAALMLIIDRSHILCYHQSGDCDLIGACAACGESMSPSWPNRSEMLCRMWLGCHRTCVIFVYKRK